mmetsp:Transcript_7447/g.21868  ORF Transcript_7447/g.21868 Transcript_7447/m.21868 type:complete len:201 (-) Transcript_7447:627-1229(-)
MQRRTRPTPLLRGRRLWRRLWRRHSRLRRPCRPLLQRRRSPAVLRRQLCRVNQAVQVLSRALGLPRRDDLDLRLGLLVQPRAHDLPHKRERCGRVDDDKPAEPLWVVVGVDICHALEHLERHPVHLRGREALGIADDEPLLCSNLVQPACVLLVHPPVVVAELVERDVRRVEQPREIDVAKVLDDDRAASAVEAGRVFVR